ncbi:MAG: tetratricopeptide repeat protein [Candidatus Omnitrophota bacterium]
MSNRHIISTITGILLIAFFTGAADAASAGREVKKAERFFREGKYDEALTSYDRALSSRPDDPVIQYNRAVTLYQKGRFVDAEGTFMSSLAAGKEELEEKNVYNMGNSRYRIGTGMEKSSPEEALKNYRTSAQFYKRSMELAPGDVDAKYNYEFVLKKIKDLKEKTDKDKKEEKEEPKEQDKKEDKQEEKKEQEKEDQKKQEEKEKQDKKEEQKKEQSEQKKEEDQSQEEQEKEKEREEQKKRDEEQKQEEERKKREQEEKEKKEQERREEERKEQQKKEEEQKKEPSEGQGSNEKPDEGEMSEEEAKMLLRGQEEEEERMRGEMKRRRSANRPEVLRDW